MFNKKKLVKCTGCNCYLEEIDAKEVKVIYSDIFDVSDKELYCKKCLPPYDKRMQISSLNLYYKTVELRVTKEGEFIDVIPKPIKNEKKQTR